MLRIIESRVIVSHHAVWRLPSPPKNYLRISSSDHHTQPTNPAMRPLTRVLLRRPIRPYPTHISGSIARFHTRQPLLLASEKVGITARIRQKLWGTSEPPGPADPYSKAEGGAAAVEEPVDMAGYEPAEDGRGLPIMGLEEQFGVWEVDRCVCLLRPPGWIRGGQFRERLTDHVPLAFSRSPRS